MKWANQGAGGVEAELSMDEAVRTITFVSLKMKFTIGDPPDFNVK